MENYVTPITPPKSRFPKKIILIAGIVLGVIVLGVAGFLAFNAVNHFQSSRQIQTILDTIPDAMSKAKADGSGYPVTLPSSIKGTKDVSLVGGGSFDGTVYCVTGMSVNNPSIQYYIDSTMTNSKAGSCESVGSASQLTKLGGLAVGAAQTNEFTLSWNASSSAAKYDVECSTDATFSTNPVKVTVTEPHATCAGLKAGQQYYVRVRSVNEDKKGAWSDPLQAMTIQQPLAPKDLTLKVVSSTQIDYSWGAVSGAKSYLLEYASDINFVKDVQTVTATGTSGSVTGLKPRTAYFFHVKAITDTYDASMAPFSEQASSVTQQ